MKATQEKTKEVEGKNKLSINPRKEKRQQKRVLYLMVNATEDERLDF